MVTPIYLSDGTAIYDRLTARAFLAEKLESDSRIKDFLVYLSGENWEKEYNDLDEAYDELKAKYNKLKDTYDELNQKYDELDAEYGELEAECDELREKLEESY